MTGKRGFRCFLMLVAALVVLAAAVPVSAFAGAAEKIYVVGVCPKFGIAKTASGTSGLADDYLRHISKFTGDRYAYREGMPEELFQMLLGGYIDMIPCVTENELKVYESLVSENPESALAFAGYSLVTKFDAVYVYDNGTYKDTNFGDVSAIKRMRIGYLPEDEADFFAGGRFVCSELEDAQFIPYSTESTLREDFVSGKIDAAVKNCFRPWNSETIVYQFNIDACRFVVRASDKTLSDKLCEGISNLFISYPAFPGDVYEKNIANYGSQKLAFSAAERSYLESKREITVAFNLASDLMQCYDRKTDSASGIFGSVVEDISRTTGLKVNLKPYETLTECMGKLSEGSVDAVYGGVPLCGLSGYPGYYISAAAARSPVVLAGKSGAAVSETAKIAAPGSNEDIVRYLERFFPKMQITPYPDEEEACGAVMRGECDLVCAGSYDLLYLIDTAYKEIAVREVLPIFHSECFVMKKYPAELCSVMENALAQINGNETVVDIYNIINSNVPVVEDDHSGIWLIITGLTVLAVLLAGLIVISAANGKRRTELDPLTGGRTKRRYLTDSAKAVKKSSPEEWAVIVFDIDKFKFINDRLGYDEGNRMLERLYKTVGDHMENGEIYARISGDVFACTVRNSPDNGMEMRLNNIFTEFNRRNSLFVSYPVLFSAGVCRLEQCAEKDGAADFNTAIDRCNIARQAIKGKHGSTVAFYDGKIRDKALREKDFENIMPQALEKREFMCYLQPKYGTKSRRIEGAEALIRWNSKEFGFVVPNDFIPLSEKNGFVVELDFFILEEVCKAMRRWLDSGKTPVVISVNQSRLHLSDDDYIWRLREIVDKYEIPYEYLELELTESVFTEDADLMLKIMQKLHDIGFKLSIDDFGSGYSSLNMLKDIPADVVKIDREFFNGTVNSEKGRAVISTVVDLAKNLDMQVISEGVETVEQVDFLQEIECNMIQGFYFAKPMTVREFEELWEKELAAPEAENAVLEAGDKE